jgi:hypothetical protein
VNLGLFLLLELEKMVEVARLLFFKVAGFLKEKKQSTKMKRYKRR